MDDPHDDYFVSARPPRPTDGGPPLPPPPSPAASRGVPALVVLVALLVVGVVVLGGVVAFVTSGPDGGPATTAGTGVVPGEATSAVGALAPVVEDGFALWGIREDGTPVRWNACEPIRWVLNPDGAPVGAQADIAEAMTLVTEASGLRFEFLGETDETPSWERSLVLPERYGDRWAPVLIAWSATGDDLTLADHQRGAAVPIAVTSSSAGSLFVTGQVIMNGDKDLRPGFGDRHDSWGAVIAHELGHLVGLDHVDDPTQLMYPEAGFGRSTFGAGDRRGLAAVGGDGSCLEVPVPRDLQVDYRDGLRP